MRLNLDAQKVEPVGRGEVCQMDIRKQYSPKDGYPTLAAARAGFFTHQGRRINRTEIRSHENTDADAYTVDLYPRLDGSAYACAKFQEDLAWIEATAPVPAWAWAVFANTLELFPGVQHHGR